VKENLNNRKQNKISQMKDSAFIKNHTYVSRQRFSFENLFFISSENAMETFNW